jgi:glycerol transport system ATP-binding protein
MNFLPARWQDGGIAVGAHMLRGAAPAALADAGEFTLGVRPEYVGLAAAGQPDALPATVQKAQDIGTYQLLTATSGSTVIRARLAPEAKTPKVGEDVWLHVLGAHTCFYNKEQELIA